MLIHPTTSSILAFSTTCDCVIDESVDVPLLMPTHQVHGTQTAVIDSAFLGQSPLMQALKLHAVDALCTDIPGLCIAVKTADCIPVLLYNDEATVISAVHAGWKGTLKRIAESNIDLLVNHYGIEPRRLHAIIGPGISLDSFEVGDEVYDLFRAAGFPMDRIAQRFPTDRTAQRPNGLPPNRAVKDLFVVHSIREAETRWHIDLWEANRLQLLGKGLKAENIHVAGVDTMTSTNFYSARRMRECPGRIINGILIKPKTT